MMGSGYQMLDTKCRIPDAGIGLSNLIRPTSPMNLNMICLGSLEVPGYNDVIQKFAAESNYLPCYLDKP